MATPNLNITHIVTSQSQKEVTANEAFDALDKALCGELSCDFTSGNVTLSDAQFRGSIAFRAANLSVARDLTVPAIKRVFVVNNSDGTNTLTVKRGSASVAVSTGTLAVLCTDGTTNGLFSAAGAGGGGSVSSSRAINTQYSLTGGGNLSADRTLNLVNDSSSPGNTKVYGTDGSGVRGWRAETVTSVFSRTGAVAATSGDYTADQITETGSNKIMTSAERTKLGKVLNIYQLAGSLPGAPTSSQRVFHHLAVGAFTLPASLTGSAGKAKTAATAQTDFDIQVNSVSKGTMRFAAAGTTASFIFSSDVSVAAGDEIEIIAPGTADATLADVVWTLKGTL